MIESFLWGAGAASSLLIGALIALRLRLPKRLLGLITAFGVGVLMSAIAFELVEEASHLHAQHHTIGLGLLAGSATFFGITYLLDKLGQGRGARQKRSTSPLAIFVGTALDAIPESIVLGLGLIGGGPISAGMLVAVFISNLPEAIAATGDLRQAKWKPATILLLWSSVILLSGAAALVGYMIFASLPGYTTAFTMCFAAGALITMIADAMMPEAYRDSKNLAGLFTTFGFFVAFWINQIF